MTAGKLRQWRGVKPVPGPSGAAITTRLRTSEPDERVLDAVAAHLGLLRRSDLAAVSRPEPLDTALDDMEKRQTRRNRLNRRKGQLTAESSARWANAIIRANDDQYRLSRDAQRQHIIGLQAAITTIETRLARPTADTLSAEQRKVRKGQAKGYPTQTERFQKQRRLQVLDAQLKRACADRDSNRVRVVDGGKRLAKRRHNLHAAGLTLPGWREKWEC
ncbi:MAG: hypothetical protein ACRDU4_20115, partial [Mycobacterium sp.]